jgi:DNA-binding response OmpR family regulator
MNPYDSIKATIDILVAEDSPTQATQIKHLLESFHYSVVIAGNGQLAMEWLDENTPKLVISDIMMPIMNGFELCGNIKSNPRTQHIPVILLTSLSNSDEVIEGLCCGADEFITKPYDKEYLISHIETIISEQAKSINAEKKLNIEICYGDKKRTAHIDSQKVVKFLLNIYQGSIYQNETLIQTRDELRLLNDRLEDLVDQRTKELVGVNKKLALQNLEIEARAAELVVANNELTYQNREKEKRADELIMANKELAFQNDEKGKRANELHLANTELAFQNSEKEKRADELSIANIELTFQNREKERRADELYLANKELAFQNQEKNKRADELVMANVLKESEEKYRALIENKNLLITQSISYAQRIQEAKLPRMNDIYESLPQSFIFFRPKDIVSGDFYFFHKNRHSVIIVVADCTGHGVPGALMSMIGSEKLAEAVALSSDTSEILKTLNRGIKNTLHQFTGREDNKDGMDCAICSIDIKARTLKYAGAKIPLLLIRKDAIELEEIKATRMSIGGYTENDQNYETHEMLLQKGDTFYLSTDGYVDQFGGGADERKLLKKNFKKILLDIQPKSMPEQERHLSDFMEQWTDGVKQIDDMLVMGVRM